ncbi:MAG TPA: alpha/beta fold hydrolase, partial [Dehalococcoidia bacterium]
MRVPRPALMVPCLLAFLAVFVSACSDSNKEASPTASDASPTVAASATFQPEVLDWSACDDSLECATLDVPLDYADPAGKTIPLALARRPADDGSARIGSLLVNPGGPGASGVDLARQADLVFPQELLDRFDIVGFDPRGVGESDAVDCGDRFDDYFGLDPTPDDDAERQALIDGARTFVQRCEEHSADILPHVDTTSAARDMDVIRTALGEDKLTYFGFSYGTYLGATYADLFPDRVRAFALDGAV